MEDVTLKKIIFSILQYIIVILFGAVVFMHIVYVYSADICLMISVGNTKIGYIKDSSVFNIARAGLESSVTEITGEKYMFDNHKITYKLVNVAKSSGVEYTSIKECYNKLNDICESGFTNAYIMKIDDVYIGAFGSQSEISEIISSLERQTAVESAKSEPDVSGARLLNDISISYEVCSKSEILTVDYVLNHLGAESNYINPEEEADDVEYGILRTLSQTASMKSKSLSADKPADKYPVELRYSLLKTEVYSEVVKASTEYVDADYYYIGIEMQQSKGSDGFREITYQSEFIDGEMVNREVISSEYIVEMIPNVILRGSRLPPPAEPTGFFIWPLEGDHVITSYYGAQRAEFDGDAYHYGIDIASEEGVFVYAADGGEVIYVDETRSYGLMIQIDHGKYITYYAHLGKANVELGEKVYPGKYIGEVGMTGVTTAPHLHFEIRGNGRILNPLDYLPES